ncbi:MAG TPA: hypothetical protein VGT41_03935 [Candidatus Babeliales bacterium]|nr:hypothetical protein [Candidatus Babeliales bacterium]
MIRMLIFIMGSVLISIPLLGAAPDSSSMHIIMIPSTVNTTRITEAVALRGLANGKPWAAFVWPKAVGIPQPSLSVLQRQRTSSCGDCFKRVYHRLRSGGQSQ